MISNEQKREALAKLLQSQEFANSKTGRELLSYLVEAAIKGTSPKETTIALEVFGRKNFNPADDSIVRSNIHNVRKKLDSYYLKEGRDDPVRMIIHRGQYRVDFIQADKYRDSLKPARNSRFQSKIAKYSMIAVFASLAIAVFYFFARYQALHDKVFPIARNDPIWSSFLQSNKPTLIVFGDYYLILENRKDLNRRQEIRDYEVDSDEDLKNYRKLTNNPDVCATYFNMLPHHTEENLFDILPVLSSIRDRVRHTVSSRLTWEEIKSNNIIYTGKIKNLRLLERFTSKLWIKRQLGKPFIHIINDAGDTLETFIRYRAIDSLNVADLRIKNYYNRDYAAILKLPGPGENTILIFMGVGYISLVETVEMLTQKQSLTALEEELKKDYGKIPQCFEMLVEVSGFRRTGLRREIKFFREIDPEIILKSLGG